MIFVTNNLKLSFYIDLIIFTERFFHLLQILRNQFKEENNNFFLESEKKQTKKFFSIKYWIHLEYKIIQH